MNSTSAFPLLDAGCFGARLGPVENTLTARMLMSYAATLAATADVYLNDLRPDGIVGLPPFLVSLEWQIMNGTPYRKAVAMDDAGMWACLHVQQDSTFHRVLRPGMKLITVGEICGVRRTRLGAYVATRLTTNLAQTGEAVAESWFCGIFLDRFPDGPDMQSDRPPELAKVAFSTTPRPLLRVDRALPHLYTEAASIWNPIHTERRRAKEAGLSDTLLHGTCTWAAAGSYLIDTCGEGDPARMRRLGGRFANPAPVGCQLFMQVEPESAFAQHDVQRFQVTDQDGRVIIADGYARFGEPEHDHLSIIA